MIIRVASEQPTFLKGACAVIVKKPEIQEKYKIYYVEKNS